MVNGSKKGRGKKGWRDVYNHAEKDFSKALRLVRWHRQMQRDCVCREDGMRRGERD